MAMTPTPSLHQSPTASSSVGTQESVGGVSFGAHTWALLCHSSKQRPSAAACQFSTSQDVPYLHTWIIPQDLTLTPGNSHCSPSPHTACLTTKAGSSYPELIHSFPIKQALMHLCNRICTFPTPAAPQKRYFCAKVDFLGGNFQKALLIVKCFLLVMVVAAASLLMGINHRAWVSADRASSKDHAGWWLLPPGVSSAPSSWHLPPWPTNIVVRKISDLKSKHDTQ